MVEVTVVVPTHNRRTLLSVTVRSILWQRGVDLEVVIIDDGSSDGTAGVVAGVGDRRMRLLRNETPQGVSAARNAGIAAARGEWVAFCDDDDLWAPDKLARQLRSAREARRAWAYTGAVSVDSRLRILGGSPPRPPEQVARLLRRFNAVPGGGSNVVVRRDALARAGDFDVQLRNTEDWEMWIRLADQGLPASVNSPLMAYRVHRHNASLDTREILVGAARIERIHATKVDLGEIYRWLGESCLRSGERGRALRYLAAAALRGQARPVSGDVVTILRRKLRNRRPAARRPPPSGPRHREWADDARWWVDELAGR